MHPGKATATARSATIFPAVRGGGWAAGGRRAVGAGTVHAAVGSLREISPVSARRDSTRTAVRRPQVGGAPRRGSRCDGGPTAGAPSGRAPCGPRCAITPKGRGMPGGFRRAGETARSSTAAGLPWPARRQLAGCGPGRRLAHPPQPPPPRWASRRTLELRHGRPCRPARAFAFGARRHSSADPPIRLRSKPSPPTGTRALDRRTRPTRQSPRSLRHGRPRRPVRVFASGSSPPIFGGSTARRIHRFACARPVTQTPSGPSAGQRNAIGRNQ